MRVMSSMSRHFRSGRPDNTCLCRTSLRAIAASRVTSALSAGSAGAASVSPSFSSIILRAMSGGSLTRSNRVAPLASRTASAICRSSARAERVSVS